MINGRKIIYGFGITGISIRLRTQCRELADKPAVVIATEYAMLQVMSTTRINFEDMHRWLGRFPFCLGMMITFEVLFCRETKISRSVRDAKSCEFPDKAWFTDKRHMKTALMTVVIHHVL